MGCLKDIKCGNRVIIGIKDYADCAEPESGLFINDIPGITLKSASAIANEEQKTGYELLKGIIYRATLLTFNDFLSQISSQFSYNAVAEIRKINYFDGSVLPTSNNERGLVLKRWRSEMAQIYVQELYIKSATSGPVTIKIVDGSETKTFTTTLEADIEKTLRVDYMAESEQIKILCDNSSVQMYSGQINKAWTGCNSCGGSAQGFYMTGWNGNSEEAKYFGIGVFASVRCNEENIVCQLLNRMNFIIWYKAGAMYYEELLATNRLNSITIFSKDRAVENKEMLEEKYNKAYADFVPTIKQLLNKTKGECITCNPSIKYANTIP